MALKKKPSIKKAVTTDQPIKERNIEKNGRKEE